MLFNETLQLQVQKTWTKIPQIASKYPTLEASSLQKPKAQPKGLLLEAAFSETASFPYYIFESWFDPAFVFWLSAFRNW